MFLGDHPPSQANGAELRNQDSHIFGPLNLRPQSINHFYLPKQKLDMLAKCKVQIRQATSPVSSLRQSASWTGDYFVVTPSAIGQPKWLTQPSIPPGSVNE